MNWYLVYTKPRLEKVALENLERQGYRCYLPMIRVEKVKRHQLVDDAEPMFPRYLFVELDTSGQGLSWSPIRSTVGVSQLVRFGTHPAQVHPDLIQAIKNREAQAAVQERLQPGDQVLIQDGPFAGLTAIFQEKDAQRRAIILLEILSRPVSMRIAAASVTPLRGSDSKKAV